MTTPEPHHRCPKDCAALARHGNMMTHQVCTTRCRRPDTVMQTDRPAAPSAALVAMT